VDAGSDFGGEELELDRDQIEMVQLDRQIMEHGAANTRNEEDKLDRRSSRYRFLQKHRNKKVNNKAAVALRNKILEYENIFYSIKVTDDEVREHRLNKKIYYLVRSAGISASEENAPGYSGGTTATP
jgi:hypothetical protein